MLDPRNVMTEIAALKLRYPDIWEDGDEKLLADCLEAETTLNEFMRVVEDRRQDAAAMCGAIATRRAALDERLARYERQEQAWRALALKVMQSAGTNKVVIPEATYSISKGREKLEILNPDSVPPGLCDTVVTPNRSKIKDFIKSGESPNWAALVQGDPSLSVRTK